MNSARRDFQPKHEWWHWIGRAWALPYTVLGLLLGLAGRSRFQVWERTVEILLAAGPVLAAFNRLGISAITLGDTVLYATSPCNNLRAHEHRHTRQYWLMGPLFLPVYYSLLLIYGYWNHPLERDARRWEEAQCGCLYSGKITAAK